MDRRAGVAARGAHTRFSLQSISKLFTALGALAAVRDGLVGLDEPIRSYLPGFTVQSRFGDDPTAQFTLRHLLSHTAGLTHEAPVGNNMLAGEGSFEDHVASISSTWLRYPVGQRYAYSNLGVDLAGHVLAVVSNTPLQERLRHSVLEPLGLGRTTFDWEVVRDDPDAARGHDRRVPDLSFHMPMLAAGGCWSTATDLTRFLGHALAGFDGFLPPELIEELYRVPGRLPGQQGGYSLGVVTFSHAGRVLHAHGGGGCGFLADLYWAPESGVGAAMLSNCTWHSLQFELVSRLIADRAGPSRLSQRSRIPHLSRMRIRLDRRVHRSGQDDHAGGNAPRAQRGPWRRARSSLAELAGRALPRRAVRPMLPAQDGP